jgi:hypothetical protein
MDSNYRARHGGTSSRLVDKFVKLCVIHPRSKAAERKIHAVWR